MNNLENGSWQVAELELVYKTTVKPSERLQVNGSREVYEVLKNNWDMNKIDHIEQSKMLVLNKALKVLGLFELSTGGIDSTIMDPRVVIANAIMVQGTSIIIAHNHPSGNLSPSTADIRLTKKLSSACKLFDLELNDHLIISSEGYYSLADHWLLE